MINVVAAVIKDENEKILITQRNLKKAQGGLWEFPGGKVEKSETEKEAVEREILEEFEMNIKAIRFITNNICKYPTKTVDLRMYECKYLSGDFKLHDHSEYAWVEINKLLDYDLAKADIPLAKYIMENKNESSRI